MENALLPFLLGFLGLGFLGLLRFGFSHRKLVRLDRLILLPEAALDVPDDGAWGSSIDPKTIRVPAGYSSCSRLMVSLVGYA